MSGAVGMPYIFQPNSALIYIYEIEAEWYVFCPCEDELLMTPIKGKKETCKNTNLRKKEEKGGGSKKNDTKGRD